MNSAGITVRGMHKYFYSVSRGKISALKNIHLDIEDGEFFVILGPSGCGKSTLLNIIAGLERQSSGEIWFGKNVVCSTEQKVFLSPKQRNVAMVFQSYALYPHMTVFDNIAFPLKIARMERTQIDKRVNEAAETVHISHLLKAKPKELSGGQRQRVAVARAIVRHPSLFLLDEPLSNIDAQLRVRMRSELKGLQRKIKVTTLYVTHDQVEAMTLGDRIAILHDGEIHQVGRPLYVYNNPTNTFVAGFLGTPPMNLLNAEILEKNKRLSIIIDNIKITAPMDKTQMLNRLKGKKFILGIRPEDIHITSQIENKRMTSEIAFVEHLGNELILHVKTDHQEILVKSPEEKWIKEGLSIGLNIDIDKMHYFDDNGRNIKEDISHGS